MTANFPSSLDDTTTMFNTVINQRNFILKENVSISATTIKVLSGLDDLEVPCYVRLEPNGEVKSASVNNGGSGYTQDDILTISGGDGTATVQVDVSAGVVTGVTLTESGSTYNTDTNIGTTGGTGTGCTLDITISSGEIFKALNVQETSGGGGSWEFDNVMRGQLGTGAVSHDAGRVGYLPLTSAHINGLMDAVEAAQKFMGQVGTHASRPATPDIGQVYIETDDGEVAIGVPGNTFEYFGGISVHGHLTGRNLDDPHTAYHNDSRKYTWHDALAGDHVTDGDSHDHSVGAGAGRFYNASGDPSSTPSHIGEIYYNYSSGDLFVAKGLTSNDWTRIVGAPPGVIVPFKASDLSSACPDGWTRYTALDGKYARGQEVSPPTVTGSHTHAYSDVPEHTHTIAQQTNGSTDTVGSHTHTVYSAGGSGSTGILGGGSSTSNYGIGSAGHSHSFTVPATATNSTKLTSDNSSGDVSGTADSTNNEPPYYEVIFCQKT